MIKKNLQMITFCFLLSFSLLTACKNPTLTAEEETAQTAMQQDGKEQESEQEDIQENGGASDDAQDEEGEQEEEAEILETSIAYKDWEIKKHPVEGLDNLYEIDLTAVLDENEWIISVRTLEQDVLLLLGNETEETQLCLLDPLTMEKEKSTVLPAGGYSVDSLKLNKSGHIVIGSYDTNEIHVLDKGLKLLKTISVPDVQAGEALLSGDERYIYYFDQKSNRLVQYDVNLDTQKALFTEYLPEFGADSYCFVSDLIGEDSSLLFSYYDEAQEKSWYEARDVKTGYCKYKQEELLSGVQSADGDYLLKHMEDGADVIIYRPKGEKPQVLMPDDFAEYDTASLQLPARAVITNVVGQTSVRWKYYDLESGKCKYRLDLELPQETDEIYGHYEGNIIGAADIAVLYIDRTTSRLLVWDLTKESSLSGDESSYLYAWQDPKHPDQETMERLRREAEQLGRENGVDIYFGEDIQNCPSDVYEYEPSVNVVRIEAVLRLLKKVLAKYPKGMLAQLDDDYGSRLHIYLCAGITPVDEIGLASSVGIQNTIEDNTYLVLDINAVNGLEGSMYHEIFHAIDKHLDQTEDGFFDYEKWDSLNPEDFSYDYDYHENEENFNYDYLAGDTEHDTYFIDSYSKSFPVEDRARIMEYAMSAQPSQRAFVEPAPLQGKLKYICEQVRKGFDTTGWPARTSWEEALIAR